MVLLLTAVQRKSERQETSRGKARKGWDDIGTLQPGGTDVRRLIEPVQGSVNCTWTNLSSSVNPLHCSSQLSLCNDTVYVCSAVDGLGLHIAYRLIHSRLQALRACNCGPVLKLACDLRCGGIGGNAHARSAVTCACSQASLPRGASVPRGHCLYQNFKQPPKFCRLPGQSSHRCRHYSPVVLVPAPPMGLCSCAPHCIRVLMA